LERTRSQWVETEGDILYAEVRGEGEPLLIIPGGRGHGGAFSALAEKLATDLKVWWRLAS
jgi:hypothetical protein